MRLEFEKKLKGLSSLFCSQPFLIFFLLFWNKKITVSSFALSAESAELLRSHNSKHFCNQTDVNTYKCTQYIIVNIKICIIE